MKKKLFSCITALFMLAGSKSVGAFCSLTAKKNIHFTDLSYSNAALPGAFNADTGQTTFKLLRLKLMIDSLNYDDIVIGFGANTSTKYNPQEDSKYFASFDAPEGLASFSSDNVRLSVNLLPLPKQTPLVIRLDVEGAKSGLFTLERTELDSLPKIYDLWLMDNYKKDSLDLRNNNSYAFYIDKSDTSSFGKHRFQVVVRQNPTLGVHLLDFAATKVNNGANTTWITENEQTYTQFTIERSIDNGATFYKLDSLASNGTRTYSFLDKNPINNGTDQYRLRITDLNGGISYSNPATLTYGKSATVADNISVYPNPSNGIINLAVKQNSNGSNSPSNLSALDTGNSSPYLAASNSNISSYDIKIISNTGSVIKTATSTSANWQANVSNLAPGTYIIQVINNTDKSLVGKNTFIKL